MEKTVNLVLGGIASGKSDFAEAVVRRSDPAPVYLATAQAQDDEMRAKITAHRIARTDGGWQTLEAPLHLAQALTDLSGTAPVLIDCATMWLTNHLMAGSDIAAEKLALLAAIEAQAASVTLVSNEVGLGGIADNALARTFAREQGRLNRDLAEIACNVVLVSAGLPLVLKGALPDV